jgi:hypothetical protein
MGTRLIVHSLLLLSVLLFGIVFVFVYGEAVNAYDHLTEHSVIQQPRVLDFKPEGKIESLRFEHRHEVNDTVTVTIRNLGNIPIRIRDLTINDLLHITMIDGYIFDQEGDFYLARTIPAGGFGIIKTTTLPGDLAPKNDSYNINVRTSIGFINETFVADSGIYSPSSVEPLTPLILSLFLGSVTSAFYYRRFKALG